jgi:two-component system phosphate regulon sensor histidine kinase PhoR
MHLPTARNIPIPSLVQLAAILERDRELLLARWREQVRALPAARGLDTPTLNDHVPSLIDELSAALLAPAESIPDALRDGSPVAHGLQRVTDGFDIEEVVAEYNILRGCIHDLADRNGINLQGEPFHVLNRVFDGAIGLAVQTYAQQQAREVQRRREEYLAFVAHDLRTPLNAVSLATTLLEMELPAQASGTETFQTLRSLRRNVQQISDLVGKVLDENANLHASDGISLQLRQFDLWPLVQTLLLDLRPVAEVSDCRLVNQVPRDLVVWADASLLRRIFQNLIANAIHYTPHGEVIIGGHTASDRGGVECWVKDNGTGIDPETIGQVFDAGQSDPRSEDGKGLGLAIVKTFVEAHGGSVSVESQTGAGTTFRLTLPGRDEAASASM